MKRWALIGSLFLGSPCLAADVTTPRMGLTAPEVGSTGWAEKTNADWSIVDSSAALLSQPNIFTNSNQFNSTVLFPNLTASQCLQLDASHQVTSQACITPPGSDTEVIYNQGGTFAGSPNFTFNNTTITVTGVAASTMTIRRIVWPDGTVQISSPTNTTGPPGAAGTSVYPATGTASFPYGLSASTVAASTVAVSALTNSVGTLIIKTSPGVNVTVSSLTFADSTVLTSTNGLTVSGAVAILNQSTLQNGATFYVPLGTLTKLVVKSTFSVEGDSITLGTPSSQISIPTLGTGPNYVKVGSGGTVLTAGSILASEIPAVSSGVVFGSASNVAKTDTNTWVYDGADYSLHFGTNPFTASPTYGSTGLLGGAGLRLWVHDPSNLTPLIVGNPFNSLYTPLSSYIGAGPTFGWPGSTAAFTITHDPTLGKVKFTNLWGATNGGDFYFQGTAGDYYLTANSSSQTVKGPFMVKNLAASQFVKTDASQNLASYDLLNATQTWTATQNFAKLNVISSGTLISQNGNPIFTSTGNALSVGYGALGTSYIGSVPHDDMAFGEFALSKDTGGVENTAIGNAALMNLTYGNNDTATGSSACANISTGIFNACFGVSALQDLITGSDNTATGATALQTETIGNNNTAIGAQACKSQNGVSQNTGVGSGALYSNGSGSNNTAVGYLAAQGPSSANPLTSGSNNTFLGAGTGVASQVNNSIAIGVNSILSKSNQCQIGTANGGGAEVELDVSSITTNLITASSGTFTTLSVSSFTTAASLISGTTYWTYNSSGTITPEASKGNNIAITLTSTATINIPIGAQDFQTFRYSVTQGAGGSHGVTLGTGFNFGVDVTTVTFSTTAGKTDYFMCLYRTASGKCDVVSSSVRGY